MDDKARRDMRNVIAFLLSDGELNERECDHIETLRQTLGFDGETFQAIVDEVRRNPKKYSMPSDHAEARRLILMLVEAAASDGSVTDSEETLLRTLATHAEIGDSEFDGLLMRGNPALAARMDEATKLLDEVYVHFARWDDATRRAKLEEVGRLDKAAVLPLIRVLESYRSPDGMNDALELKTRVTEQLGELGDDRAVYYLAQQVGVGDLDDEITNDELRYAVAEALGRITGQGFSRDQQGVEDARAWWLQQGRLDYNTLAI